MIITQNKVFTFLIGMLLCCIASSSKLSAQENHEYGIQVISRAYVDSIALRWAPDKPVAWYFSNDYGYRIERYTIVRDGEVMTPPVKKVLNMQPLKPTPLDQWEAFAEQSDYAAIAAQAIYGESFEMETASTSNATARIIHKTRELESRFSFALSCADFSPKVAQWSGLYFVDREVQPNERYLYKICPLVPESKLKMDTGYVYTSLDEAKPLPTPRRFDAEFREQSVFLSWDYRFHRRVYIAYVIERSSDGGETFKQVNEQPFVNMVPDPTHEQQRMVFVDSLPRLNKAYHYRIRGLNSFGELGPPSDTLSGYGRAYLGVNPSITEHEVHPNLMLSVTWSYPDSLNSKLKGFRLKRSVNDQGPFNPCGDDLIAPVERSVLDTLPSAGSFYYKIEALDAYNQVYGSYPVLVKTIDSIPPGPPRGLSGAIDTGGGVHLRWANNEEEDLLGYRVYRSHFSQRDFVQVTTEHVTETLYLDSVEINTLSKKVFYQITAIDNHFNESEFSEPLRLVKPDKVPPVKPVFKNVSADAKGIRLNWYNSSSDDVDKHLLYRKQAGDPNWKLIQLFQAQQQTFFDTTTRAGKMYRYTLVAVDETGLESGPCKPVTMRQYNPGIRRTVENIEYYVDKENYSLTLNWEYPVGIARRFLIYRKRGDQPLTLYDSVDSGSYNFIDDNLEINQNYTYRIRVVFTNQTKSKFSHPVSVKL